MSMQGRQYVGDFYRFGYQGSEKEREGELKGIYTTEFRGLDVRLGRWFIPDPVTHPWQSPYCSMDNDPIGLTDVMGLSTDGGGGPGKGTPPGSETSYLDEGEGGGCWGGGSSMTPSSSEADLSGSMAMAYFQFKYTPPFQIPRLEYNQEEIQREMVEYGENGEGFAPGTPTAMVNATINLLNGAVITLDIALNRVKRDAMASQIATAIGDKCSEAGHYLSKNTISDMVNKFLDALEEMLITNTVHADDYNPANSEIVFEVIYSYGLASVLETAAGTEAVINEIAVEETVITTATEAEVVGSITEEFEAIILHDSPQKVLGSRYVSTFEKTTSLKKGDLLDALNKVEKGDWVKVYEAGVLEGSKVEVHYFRNNLTGKVFDVKVKYEKWHQKAFKNIPNSTNSR